MLMELANRGNLVLGLAISAYTIYSFAEALILRRRQQPGGCMFGFWSCARWISTHFPTGRECWPGLWVWPERAR